MQSRLEVSVVVPCLNEEAAVGDVVDQAWLGIHRSGRTGEVIVADNGSSDASAEIAAAHGARVVVERRQGYGSAYLAGLDHARGDFIVMADADGTYPVAELGPFVERLAAGDDLVMGSRFAGNVDRGAMPWLNRYVGNPILTGMLNLFFGVRISDAHCGMRAVRRDALASLDLHSTGMEFASEMVFKAFRRDFRVSEIPIDYHARIGDSKLNRFSDAWRHVCFMLLYSPAWLFLGPGLVLLAIGLGGMLALASGPVDVLGRTWQIHTMLGFVAFTLIGAQVVQLWLFAHTVARTRFGAEANLTDRIGRHLTLGRGVAAGFGLVVVSVAILGSIVGEWAVGGFGALEHEYTTALAFTLLGLGVQVVFSSFFIALLTMRTSDEAVPRGVVVADGVDSSRHALTSVT